MGSKNYLYLPSSIMKKQIVALTGLLLISFVCGHLSGNLLLFAGPKAFNAYAAKLTALGPVLYLIEAGLLAIFIVHMVIVGLLVLENWRARPHRYEIAPSSKKRSLATRTMPYTGFIIIAFIIWHLLDFKFSAHQGDVAGVLQEGLYARVYVAFSNPIHSVLYILAMFAVGLHLAHAIQSFCQTFGLTTKALQPKLVNVSLTIGLIVAIAFSSMPIFIMIKEKIADKSGNAVEQLKETTP